MEYKEICLKDKIGEVLCEFAENDNRIYVIDSDLAKSTKTLIFKEKYPTRFIQAGIAEASAVSIAEGLATEGKIPFYVNFATFVTGTAWTQVRQSAYANSNVKLIGTYVGMDNGPDGASHHANEDIALMRMIPNMKILVPSNVKELKQSIKIAIDYNGPVYIRVTRDVVTDVELEQNVEVGKSIIVEEQYKIGDTVTINDFKCEVLAIGFRTTRLKAYTGEVMIISNRNIQKVINHSFKSSKAIVDVMVSYEEDLLKVEKVLSEVCDKLSNEIKELKSKIFKAKS